MPWLRRIRNDQVEHEVDFAHEGSAVPADLHGIWWMDQRGKHVRAAWDHDPEYKQVCSRAADEILTSFASLRWYPQHRCGVNFKPPSTLFEQEEGSNKHWDRGLRRIWSECTVVCETERGYTLLAQGSWVDENLTQAWWQRIRKAGDVMQAAKVSIELIRTPWGFDRFTRVPLRGDCHYVRAASPLSM